MPPGLPIERAVEVFSRLPEVAFAEPNYILRAQAPMKAEIDDQWALNKINASDAWSVIPEGATAVLAIVDTGIEHVHPDLSNNIRENEAELNGDPNVDDDGNGYTDDTRGWDFFDWDFGDGNTGSGVVASHTYEVAGTYTVVLTATDDGGVSDTDTQNVLVGVSPGTMFVFAIDMSGKAAGLNRSATAVVAIYDDADNPLEGAAVYGRWSGDYSGDASGVTGPDGTVLFTSGKVREASATFTFTVIDVVKSGYTYDPDLDNETSDTIVVL